MPRLARLIFTLCFAVLFLTPSARADDGLARMRERGFLRVATDATYPPFEFVENGNVVGFDREIGDEIGREIGVRVEFVSMEWSGVFASLETGQCDLVMSGVTITAPRKKGNAFSRPYFLSGQVLARRKGDTTIAKPEDLLGGSRVAAVQQETTGQFAMERIGLPKARQHRFDTLQDALLDTRNGKSDAAVGDAPALADMIRKGYPEMEIASPTPFVEENLGIVARTDSRDLVAAINTALARIMADGRYTHIYEKWMREPCTLEKLARLESVKSDGTPIPEAIAATIAAKTGTKGETPQTAATGSAFTIRFDVLRGALPLLVKGAGLTLLLTACTLLLGVPAGLLIALARLAPVPPLRAAATVYVEIVRGTPLLMQIYVIYFVLPALGVSLPPFAAGLAALSLNAAAYVSEIFRAGIESIEAGQKEAGQALGMSDAQTLRYIVLPQTVRRVLPPLTNEAVALLKDSSLVSVVALSELMRVGKEVATTAGAPTTIYLAVALLYLAMTLPLTTLVRHLETRWLPISHAKGDK